MHLSSAVGKVRNKVALEHDTPSTSNKTPPTDSCSAEYDTVDSDLLEIINEMGIELESSVDLPAKSNEPDIHLTLETNEPEFTEFSELAIEYIGGYVSFQLSKRWACDTCRLALSESCVSKNNLIATKSRGGLTQPSWGVVYICRHCENVIRVAMQASGSFLSKKFDLEELTKAAVNKMKGEVLFSSIDDRQMISHFLTNTTNF